MLLGHPDQDVVISAYVLYVAYRLPAPRVTVTSLAEPFLFTQQRQILFYVHPVVRITLVFLGQEACVLEMAEADSVGGPRQPGPVRFNYVFRYTVDDARQVFGATGYALFGVCLLYTSDAADDSVYV